MSEHIMMMNEEQLIKKAVQVLVREFGLGVFTFEIKPYYHNKANFITAKISMKFRDMLFYTPPCF